MTKTLDIGCGKFPRNPFNADEIFGIDVRDDLESNIYKADLVIDPIPFPTDTFEFVTAYDFIEHIPRLIYAPTRRTPFIELMNEVWRVLKVGGKFYSSTPAFPYAVAFKDPTHVNFITDQTFTEYFCGDNWARMYGFIGNFKMENQIWQNSHLIATMIKLPN